MTCPQHPNATWREVNTGRRVCLMAHPLLAALNSQERSGAWLARKTGKSPAYVNKVINGTRRPSHDFQVRAAIALATPIEDLFPAPAPTRDRRALAPEAASA